MHFLDLFDSAKSRICHCVLVTVILIATKELQTHLMSPSNRLISFHSAWGLLSQYPPYTSLVFPGHIKLCLISFHHWSYLKLMYILKITERAKLPLPHTSTPSFSLPSRAAIPASPLSLPCSHHHSSSQPRCSLAPLPLPQSSIVSAWFSSLSCSMQPCRLPSKPEPNAVQRPALGSGEGKGRKGKHFKLQIQTSELVCGLWESERTLTPIDCLFQALKKKRHLFLSVSALVCWLTYNPWF